MTFFDEVKPPPREPDYRTPEWLSPPENVIPATVALDVMLVRRDHLAVWVADAFAYPTGLSFAINMQQRRSVEHVPFFFGPPDPDGPRFGLLLADGTKVVVDRLGGIGSLSERPARPILRPCSGSGGGHRSRADMWLWPLPPPGPLTFVCAWPAEGIEETSAEVDSAPILAAAERAIELWPDDRPLPPRDEDVVI